MMNDLITLISKYAGDPSQQTLLCQEIESHIAAVRATARHGNRDLVQQAEQAIRRNPTESFTFDGNNYATLTVVGHSWQAGRFEAVAIGELKELAQGEHSQPSKAQSRLWVLDGASPATDIGALQATCADTLFQVASQFNCLESPGPHVTAVMNYFDDTTQGPRASISAFPATLLRHYSAPGNDGSYFVQQTNGQQIDLLADACGRGVTRNGYFTGRGITDPERIVDALETNFDKIRVGVHDNAQVVLGFGWDGSVDDSENRRIDQVFTSTVAGGGYEGRINLGERAFIGASRQLLRAAYLGTILAAVCLGRKRVVLTLIGGGVFQNPIALIWESIEWALDEVSPFLVHDLDVILNGFNIGRLINLDQILPSIRNRDGVILRFNESGILEIKR